MAKITINEKTSTIHMELDPSEARFVAGHLPYDGLALQLLHMIEQLRSATSHRQECPGSGTEGIPQGALLFCPVCKRLIGVHPPTTLAHHDAPVFDDGVPIL